MKYRGIEYKVVFREMKPYRADFSKRGNCFKTMQAMVEAIDYYLEHRPDNEQSQTEPNG